MFILVFGVRVDGTLYKSLQSKAKDGKSCLLNQKATETRQLTIRHKKTIDIAMVGSV